MSKTLIIHLSDLHLSERTIIDASGYEKTLSCFTGYSKCFVLFSGDMMNKGERFSCFASLFKYLKRITDRVLGLDSIWIFVPGNHDIYLGGGDVENKIVSSTLDNEGDFEDEISKMNESLTFCKNNKTFASDPVISSNTFDYDDIRYHFTLLNSAPYSTKNKIDKEHHYIPKRNRELFGNPCFGKRCIELFVSHHRSDWFEYESKKCIDDFVDNTVSIAFYGHEHETKASIVLTQKGQAMISNGGELKIANKHLIGSFNIISIDEGDASAKAETYSFDSKNNIFVRNSGPLELKMRINNSFEFNPDFAKKEYAADISNRKTNIKDLFVMPILESLGERNDVETFEDAVLFAKQEHDMFLFGRAGFGKTILLKQLLNEIKQTHWCLFFKASDISTRNINTNLKNAFEEMYGPDDYSFSLFSNLPKEQKAVFFDDLDLLSNKTLQKEYLKYFQDNFDIRVITFSSSYSQVSKKLGESFFNINNAFRCLGLSLFRRRELIKNVCKVFNLFEDSECKMVESSVESAIALSTVIDFSDPSSIVELASRIISDKLYVERNTSDAFSLVFSYNIQKLLSENGQTEKLDEYYSILQCLAYNHVYTGECDSITFNESELRIAWDQSRSIFPISLSYNDVCNTFFSSKILVPINENEFRFQRNSFMSYFAALEISRLYSKNGMDVVRKMVDNITVGLNSDIFLFFIHERHEVRIFFEIVDTLDKALKNVEEISFDPPNNQILLKNDKFLPETKAQAENKATFYNRLNEKEKRKIKDASRDEENVFSDEESTFIKSISKAMKLIEICAKAASGFKKDIEQDERELLVNGVVESTLKLINFMFQITEKDLEKIKSEFEKDKEQIIEKLENENENSHKITAIRKLDIIHYLYSFLTTTLLNHETAIARLLSSDASSSIVLKMRKQGFVYDLLKLIVCQQTRNVNGFISLLKDIYSKNPRDEIKMLTNRVVRMFVVTNDIPKTRFIELSQITNIDKAKLLYYSYKGKNE